MITGCEKMEKMHTSIETLDASNISAYSAELNGNLASENNLQISKMGFCWGLEHDPVFLHNSVTLDGKHGKFNYETKLL